MQDAHFTFDSAAQPWAAKYVTQLGLVYDLHQNMDLGEYKLQPNSGKCSTSKVDYAKALAACSSSVCCVRYSDIITVSTHAPVAPLTLCALL